MTQKVVFDPDSSISVRPQLSDQDIRDLALSCFGLEIDPISKLKELNSYDDRNYIVDGKIKPRGNKLDEKYKNYSKFTLKVFNTSFACKYDWYENINKIICASYDECSPHFKLPLPVCGTDNVSMNVLCDIPLQPGAEVVGTLRSLSDLTSSHEMLSEKDGVFYAKHMARLCVFIPGVLVDTKTMTDSQAFNYGAAGAVLDVAMHKIPPPEIDVQEKFIWNSVNVMKFGIREKYVKTLKNNDRKDLVEKVLEQFSSETLPKLLGTEKQWVHGDLNEQNILYSDEKSNPDDLVGIIDFDDLLYSHRVVDLASALMYITNIIDSPAMKEKSLRLARMFYRGYSSKVQLTEVELDCVYDLMLVRYVLSCCISTYQYDYVDPGNEYLLISSKLGWGSMKELVELGKERFMNNLLEA